MTEPAVQVDAARRFLRRTIEAPPEVDPIALLRAHPGEPWFAWERADAGEAIAAVGVAHAIEPVGEARFALAARALAGLTVDAQGGDAPLLVGGFAFDPLHEAQGAWCGFPASRWWMPRLCYVRRRGRAALVATCGASRDAAPSELQAALTRPVQPAPPPLPRSYRLAALEPPEVFRDAVRETLAEIEAGRLAKLVLSRRCEVVADRPLSPLRALERLRASHPGCTVFAVGDGARVLVGATPEMLARLRGDRLETAAVAGTAPSGSDGAGAQLGRELLASVKNRHEHALVVDDVRARLASLSGEIEAPPAPQLLSTEALQHLHTPLRARLRAGVGLLEVVDALHPTPALCGTPRALARSILRRREPASRGWYGGGIGWLDADGGAVAVAIRGALIEGSRALLHAGAGIVAGSVWEDEVEETRLKMRPLLAALLET
jgi:isochorismate synthase